MTTNASAFQRVPPKKLKMEVSEILSSTDAHHIAVVEREFGIKSVK
jgi:hypothetical protein